MKLKTSSSTLCVRDIDWTGVSCRSDCTRIMHRSSLFYSLLIMYIFFFSLFSLSLSLFIKIAKYVSGCVQDDEKGGRSR